MNIALTLVAFAAVWMGTGVVLASALGPRLRQSGDDRGSRGHDLASSADRRAGEPLRWILPASIVAVALGSSTGLAAAGVLPPRVQVVARSVLGTVGLEVPDAQPRPVGEVPAGQEVVAPRSSAKAATSGPVEGVDQQSSSSATATWEDLPGSPELPSLGTVPGEAPAPPPAGPPTAPPPGSEGAGRAVEASPTRTTAPSSSPDAPPAPSTSTTTSSAPSTSTTTSTTTTTTGSSTTGSTTTSTTVTDSTTTAPAQPTTTAPRPRVPHAPVPPPVPTTDVPVTPTVPVEPPPAPVVAPEGEAASSDQGPHRPVKRTREERRQARADARSMASAAPEETAATVTAPPPTTAPEALPPEPLPPEPLP